MSFALDKLPIGAFDLLFVGFLAIGVMRGRKNGMSAELLSLLMWLTILLVCAVTYEQLGGYIAQTTPFSLLTSFILVYIGGALLIVVLFALLKHSFGGKLIGSDLFGSAEYYLGMGSGFIRFACILIALLALLNACEFTPDKVRAMEKFQNDVYGSNFFPGLHEVQTTVFEKSLAGSWIKNNLSFLLIKPTVPENKQLRRGDLQVP